MATVLAAAPAVAQTRSTNDDWIGKNDLGGAGLIQTRSARMSPDGMLDIGYSIATPYKRYYITLQALPWLEGTFRYTEIQNKLFSQFESFSGKQTFKDRGADISIRLLEESKFLPAIAVTLQDGLGTGQFAGEYLTLNKRYYDLDFSGGITWGHAASGSLIKNPLTQLSPVFAARQGGGSTGGQFTVGNYFSGETIALFGGFAYRTPIDGLTLKWEYDPNDYQDEPQNNVLDKNSPYNYGIMYRPFPWLEASLSHERGHLTTLRMSMRSNVHDKGMPKFDPPPMVLKPRAEIAKSFQRSRPGGDKKQSVPNASEKTLADADAAAGEEHLDASNTALSKMFEDFSQEGFPISAFEIVENEVRVGVEGWNAAAASQKAEKMAQFVSAALPEHIERITLAGVADAEDQSAVTVGRDEIERTMIVDFLFDSLKAEGLRLDNLSFSHSEVEVAVSRLESDAKPSVQVAQAVLRTLPTPITKVSLILSSSGHVVERIEYARDEIDRTIGVDTFFDAMEHQGLKVEGLDYSRRKATLHIAGTAPGEAHNYPKIAEMVAAATPMPLDEVVVVTVAAGLDSVQATVRRMAADGSNTSLWATSGSSDVKTTIKPQWSEADKDRIAKRLFAELEKEEFLADGMLLDGYSITVYGVTRRFRQFARSLGRVMRIIANNVPVEIEEMTVASMSAGMEMNRVTIRRKDLERAIAFQGSPEEIWANSKIEPGEPGILLPEGSTRNWRRYPHFNWTLSPRIRSHVGGPDQFVLYQFWASLGASLNVWRGMSVSGLFGRDVYNNFYKIKLESDSQLPRVRSDIAKYLKQGTNNIINLKADYLFSPLPEWYARVSGGLFEEMFGGYSAEILHRSFNSRFAIGADINKVRQRQFDQLLEFQKYEVVTGHLNVYYELPWYNLLGSVNVGQYLAGDKGVTFSMSRQFDSGVSVGVWATLTDVSAEQFGEGSFDKGFAISLPFELFMTKSSTKSGSFGFRPLFRDGGQMLVHGPRLYSVTSAANYRSVFHEWDRFLD